MADTGKDEWINKDLEVEKPGFFGRLVFKLFHWRPARFDAVAVASAVDEYVQKNEAIFGKELDLLKKVEARLEAYTASVGKHPDALKWTIEKIEKAVGPTETDLLKKGEEITQFKLASLMQTFGLDTVNQALDDLFPEPRVREMVEYNLGPHLFGGVPIVRGRCVQVFLSALDKAYDRVKVNSAITSVIGKQMEDAMRVRVAGHVPAEKLEAVVVAATSMIGRSDDEQFQVGVKLLELLKPEEQKTLANALPAQHLDVLSWDQWELVEANVVAIREAVMNA